MALDVAVVDVAVVVDARQAVCQGPRFLIERGAPLGGGVFEDFWAARRAGAAALPRPRRRRLPASSLTPPSPYGARKSRGGVGLGVEVRRPRPRRRVGVGRIRSRFRQHPARFRRHPAAAGVRRRPGASGRARESPGASWSRRLGQTRVRGSRPASQAIAPFVFLVYFWREWSEATLRRAIRGFDLLLSSRRPSTGVNFFFRTEARFNTRFLLKRSNQKQFDALQRAQIGTVVRAQPMHDFPILGFPGPRMASASE